jgi:5-bromo-4-chloroindolyl phosphate hydrolysis protein
MSDLGMEVKYRARKAARRFGVAVAGIWLFLLPLPLLVNAVWMLARGSARDVLLSLGFYAVFAVSGWLVRRASALEARALGDPLGRAPRLPYRSIAAVLAGLATFGTAWSLAWHDVWVSILFGIGAGAGVLALYGLDRFGAHLTLTSQAEDMVFEALDQARRSLAELRRMRMNMQNREFRDRLDRLNDWGERIVKQIREDHRDLKRAREFLNVYLEGAIKVTANYLKTHGHAGEQGATLEARYRELLEGMEREFEAQHARLLRDDILDLDVELELLTQQLRQKGML